MAEATDRTVCETIMSTVQRVRKLETRVSCLAVFAMTAIAYCGAERLSISGSVRDQHGVVPGAKVSMQGPSGLRNQLTTDAEGRYRFDGLSAGSYQLTFSREGFATTTQTLSLAGDSRTLDVVLTVAGLAASVDVVDVVGKSTGSRMEISDREIPSQI